VRRALALLIGLLALAPGAPAGAVTLAKVGDFASPVYMTAPLGDTSRVFVVEQRGTIELLRGGSTSGFLDISDRVLAGGERGLLSMAFPEDFAASGVFYVYYTARDPVGEIHISQMRVDPANADRADPSYERVLVRIPHDQQGNHNGGQLQFGPDGLLYAGTGDGGAGGDPSGNAQNTAGGAPTVVTVGGVTVNHDYRLGKLLRIDPASGAISIFAYGLRNPFRFSYDRQTGDLIIGDVGQGAFEEVDFGGRGGENYGWNRFEGLHTYPAGAPITDPAGTVLPVLEYAHSGGRCSITGGYVVRDPALPELAGTYVFGDFCEGRVLGARLPGAGFQDLGLGSVPSLSSFGEDGCGRVYVTSLNGPVYRLATSGACAGPAPFVGRLPAAAGATPAAPVAAGPDRRAPALALRAAARQHVLRTGFVAVRIACDELCSVRVSGTVLLARTTARAARASALRTRTAKATLAAGRRATLRLKLTRATRAKIKRSLSRPRRHATVRVTVTAADRAGNRRGAVRRVRIVR
jgi:glucose/arabinose dehydrogenase